MKYLDECREQIVRHMNCNCLAETFISIFSTDTVSKRKFVKLVGRNTCGLSKSTLLKVKTVPHIKLRKVACLSTHHDWANYYTTHQPQVAQDALGHVKWSRTYATRPISSHKFMKTVVQADVQKTNLQTVDQEHRRATTAQVAHEVVSRTSW